jgi:hypothetical protein
LPRAIYENIDIVFMEFYESDFLEK